MSEAVFLFNLCFCYSLLDHVDGVGHAKLYVVPVPRTATEADVSYCFL